MKIISVGEVLWDVIGGEEHLGGAPLNLAAHARQLGHESLLVSAVGNDERGDRALASVARLGLETRFIARSHRWPTGTASVALDAQRQPRFTIHRPAAYDDLRLGASELQKLLSMPPDWICFGTLCQMSAQARTATRALLTAAGGKGGVRAFYDVNLRPNCGEPPLIQELLESANVVKLNEQEAADLAPMVGGIESIEEFCRKLARQFNLETVCVTRGGEGCSLLSGREYVDASGFHVVVVDAVGAGDAFSAALMHALAAGWPAQDAAVFANRIGALIAARPGAIPKWTLEELDFPIA